MERITTHPVVAMKEGRQRVPFSFDGRQLEGFEGEAVSSALFANGIRTFSTHPKDGSPQGIFCANGQCSQCAVVIDGRAVKSCVTPLARDMDVRTLRGLPALPADDAPFAGAETRDIPCDVLIVGAGPSGLGAAAELGKLGLSVVLADDKDVPGGKLVLQTHKFFGSEEDCYAGMRGIDIATKLSEEVAKYPNVRVFLNSPVAGLYNDKKAGIWLGMKSWALVSFRTVIVAAGAREKSLAFPGNDLPGVYGAGAFQTLVNRDLVKAARRVFIVGSGNVGLIAAYHALQAGIEVAGICEIAAKPNGYKVHADKIVRMGVPIHFGTTVVSADGDGKVERVTVARVDASYRPLLETARTYEVDTVLVAAGLSPCDEFWKEAESYGYPVIRAGDAEEIAEASSALFGGRIAALAAAKILGMNPVIDASWIAKREVLKSRPGEVREITNVPLVSSWRPVFSCSEEIPCNPCTTVCPTNSIRLTPRLGTIMDTPEFSGEDCRGCSACVAACPGLAVTLVREIDHETAEVVLPWEFPRGFSKGDPVDLVDRDGNFLERGKAVKTVTLKTRRTSLVHVAVSRANAIRAAGIRAQDPSVTVPLETPSFRDAPRDAIVCRCERVTFGELVDYVRDNGVRDVSQLKSIRAGMGACGSKTCSGLYPAVFRAAEIDWKDVAQNTPRPLNCEVPMGMIVNEGVIK